MKNVYKIPYQKTNYFSKTVTDYLSQNKDLQPFYSLFPTIENFKKQIEVKKDFLQKNRDFLVANLQNQYDKVDASDATIQNIKALASSKTFTVTTGHQLNIFTGPLYFLYKIIATINLAKQLKKAYPSYHFVPIYWMATEDHDFDEINHFTYKKTTLQWQKNAKGAVGRLDTKGLEAVFEKFSAVLGKGKNATYLKELFQKSYIEHRNLSDATFYLANELFKEDGLVIIDADKRELKELFSPYVKSELLNQMTFNKVSETLEKFSENYKIQVNPREINLFYLDRGLRERIILNNGKYIINNTDITFTKSEILEELTNFPEKFSPNVIMRPLYQEVILPNLAYIGGGGELAYWLELKSYFETEKIPFPILLLRNSALLITKKQVAKIEKLGVSITDIFLLQNQLINKIIKEKSNLNLDFSEQKEFLKEQFNHLKEVATKTDKSFLGAVLAQEKKQLKGLEKLEKRLLKAEKRKLKDITNRTIQLQNELFPNGSLQERQINFSEFHESFGNEFIDKLKENLQPLEANFTVLVL